MNCQIEGATATCDPAISHANSLVSLGKRDPPPADGWAVISDRGVVLKQRRAVVERRFSSLQRGTASGAEFKVWDYAEITSTGPLRRVF